MYYRRKLLLGILEKFEGKLNHTNLQKILFLVTRKQSRKSFDFVPYKYGSFSFQANQDLMTMTKRGFIESHLTKVSSEWRIIYPENFFNQLNKEDQAAILTTKNEIKGLSQRELIKHTYINYPFYAINSQIADDLLNKEQLRKVQLQRRSISEKHLFTLGYEGVSLETYVNKLILNDVKLLCDVRKNSLSMKYGFSKNQLKNACESIGIKYLHIPKLGIESNKRQKLNSLKDYEKLFEEYEKSTLKENHDSILEVSDLLEKYSRVALTCFEKEACMCHRSRVVKSLKKLPNWNIKITNL
ncbi:MAG: hypothetical protein CL840_17640 [Crocinitomicaceae bacterium]|nr:hypothetical protein [Crocinitomicaceae bacterium]|tara:strand:- start:3138 stop:4034 length:897 start_codon:yes stop_codon:yes gene_type:complete